VNPFRMKHGPRVLPREAARSALGCCVCLDSDRESREWSLYWTARGRPIPHRLVPTLVGWGDLDEREAAADLQARHPILIDPEFRVDPVLAGFLARSRFAWLADGTREAYAKDYRLFFSFLWQRGKYWHEADPDDLLDWESWRRRGPQPGRIGGSKWQRELAALRLLYEWAEKKGHITRSPVLVHAVRLRDGSTVITADQAPRDVRCSDVKWVTPRTYRLWLEVGLLGYDTSGQPDPSWRGRNDGRNAAFTDLLFSSGLRLREGGCLLTLEIPDAVTGHLLSRGHRRGRGRQAARAHVLRLGRLLAACRRVHRYHPGRGGPPRPAEPPLRSDPGETDRHQGQPRCAPEAVLAR